VRRPGPPTQTWQTFIRNHLAEIVAIDFFTVHTAAFRTLYVLLVLSLDRRRVVHFNVTTNPTADWTSLQLIQAFPFDTAPRFVVRDRDSIYGENVISYQSPWQNGYVERVIGSIRRECLDHMVVFGERHLRRVLKDYLAYYHESRTHLGLDKDAPEPRAVQAQDAGPVASKPILGGLHHRYYRDAA
jgi:putative transposase